ncbi:MAG: YIP1 family protein [Pararhodobacter sp.]|nr:YIP1 family protein [Pararhodobacter sp.]
MTQTDDLLALVRLTVADPVEGGRAVLALNPPVLLRWMLLAAAILVSVVLIYLLPVLTGQAGDMPSPFAFAAGQGVLNGVVVALVAYAGRAFGGTGSFDDALLLMAWLQSVTVALLVLQLAVLVLIPALNLPVTLASIVISVWMLVGFVCALHGFQSRIMVLVGGVMVFTITAFVLSLVLLFLGFDLSGATDV